MDLDPGTPRRTHPSRTPRYWLPGHETLGPVRRWLLRGSFSFTCVMADHPPLRWLHAVCCRPTRNAPFWSGG